MKTSLEFKSDQFPSYGDETEGVNWDAGIYGKRLADFLVKELAAKDIHFSSHYPEDWGWCLEVQHGGNFRMFIGCGSVTETENEFRCFVEPSTPQIKKWFKTIDFREPVEKLSEAIYAILAASPGIQNLLWLD
jgi:hypothetical protein